MITYNTLQEITKFLEKVKNKLRNNANNNNKQIILYSNGKWKLKPKLEILQAHNENLNSLINNFESKISAG